MNDSLALLLASVASVLAGALRLKLTAVWFGAGTTAMVAQLTQLYVLIFTFATLGLGTGIRVTLARTSGDEERRDLARRIVTITVLAAVVLVLLAQPFASELAERFLHDSDRAVYVRLALLAAIPAVAVQTMSAVLQSEFEFARVALATVLGAVFGCLAIVLAADTHSVRLIVLTIPLLPLIQLGALLSVSPRARSTFRFGTSLNFAGLWPVLQIGLFSFLLAGADTLGDTLVRGTLASRGGLELVAQLQPMYLLTGQGFTLLLGAVSSALMVHVARELRDGTADSVKMARTSIRFVAVIGMCALAVQSVLVMIVRVMYSPEFLNGVDAARLGVAAEPLNALAWAYGAALLPLGRRKAWLAVGLATVVTLFGSALLLLPHLHAQAVGAAYFVGWGVSAVGTTVALRGTPLRPGLRAWTVTGAATLGLLTSAHFADHALVAWLPVAMGSALLVGFFLWRLNTPSLVWVR